MRMLQPSDVSCQRFVILWLSFMQSVVVKTFFAPKAQLRFIVPAGLPQTFERPVPEPVFSHFRQSRADDQRVVCFQYSLVPQLKERRQELPPSQIAGRTDDDEHMGFNLLFRHLQDSPREGSIVSYAVGVFSCCAGRAVREVPLG